MSGLRLSVTPPTPQTMAGWFRSVARLVNSLLAAQEAAETRPFQMLDAAPAMPVEGQAYYDTTTHKLRVFDGTLWQDAW